MSRRFAFAFALMVAIPVSADAYLQFTFSVAGEQAPLQWESAPVRWYATSSGAAGVSAADFQAAVARAFATWQAVPTASVAFQFAGFSSALPFEEDDLSVLGFLHEPDMDRVLGATSFVVDAFTGELLESDVFFNAVFAWSVSAGGETGRFDLQSVATHEIGHFLGLAHSALGETELTATGGRRVLGSASVMFPIAFASGNIADRELQPDDIAGVSDLYPDAGFRASTGVARGRVRIGGRGVLGAHVAVFNPKTGATIGGFSLTEEGEFEIAGLTPGPHVVRIEPLDDAGIDSFFDPVDIDVGFVVTYYPRLFVAPAGGVGERFDVTVRPK